MWQDFPQEIVNQKVNFLITTPFKIKTGEKFFGEHCILKHLIFSNICKGITLKTRGIELVSRDQEKAASVHVSTTFELGNLCSFTEILRSKCKEHSLSPLFFKAYFVEPFPLSNLMASMGLEQTALFLLQLKSNLASFPLGWVPYSEEKKAFILDPGPTGLTNMVLNPMEWLGYKEWVQSDNVFEKKS